MFFSFSAAVWKCFLWGTNLQHQQFILLLVGTHVQVDFKGNVSSLNAVAAQELEGLAPCLIPAAGGHVTKTE